jgi:hypothetical protein
MGSRDPRVDAYIGEAAAFARPILDHLRALVHEACPEVTETIKWGHPNFEHRGTLCGMAAFKAHCTFAFWKASLLTGTPGIGSGPSPVDQFGRLASVADLPSRSTLLRLIQKAATLNEEGVKPERPRGVAPRELAVPDYFLAALRKNRKALATFEAFPYSHKKEYVEWVAAAKRDETRQRRLDLAVTQMAEGKTQNWKYERK